jgi:predicted DNA-binding antitoxin AbrB/MazE fold protein
MSISFEATYEGGVLKPTTPLPLAEHQVVQVTIHSSTNWVHETRGIVEWKGDFEELRRLALAPGWDLEEEA